MKFTNRIVLIVFSSLAVAFGFQNCGNKFEAQYAIPADGKTLACPAYMEPLCNAGEVITITPDANNCPMPKCVSKKSLISCPIYNRPLCETNEVLMTVTDENGCQKPVCVAK